MMKFLWGIIICASLCLSAIWIYDIGFEDGRDHQVEIDCERRGLVFKDRICWVRPPGIETALRGTL